MKKISKETNIAFALMFLASAITINLTSWYLIIGIIIAYIALVITINIIDNRRKAKRKKLRQLQKELQETGVDTNNNGQNPELDNIRYVKGYSAPFHNFTFFIPKNK